MRDVDAYLFNRNASNLAGVSLGCHYYNAVHYKADLFNPYNQVVAMIKRIGATHPPIVKGRLEEFREFVKRFIHEELQPLRELLSFSTWLESRRDYTVKVKERFAKIHEELQNNNGAALTDREISEIYFVLAFIKDEFYPEEKFPRGIYSRSDIFKVLTGPFFKSIEVELFKLPWFIKNIPVSERPAFLEKLFEGLTGCASTDFTSFESSFLDEIFEACEFQLYEYMAGDLSPDLWEIIRSVLSGANYIKFRDGPEAVLLGKRCSGEMCTSLGNGFTNLMLILFSYWKQFGCHWSEVRAVVEGDDGNHNSPYGVIDNTTFTELGFTVKMDYNHQVNKASFCGLIYEDGVNISDPVKIILRFGWTKNNYLEANEKTYMKLIRAKALSFAHQYPGCPIVSTLAHHYLALTRKCKLRRDDPLIARMGFWFNETLPEWEGFDDEANIPRRQTTVAVRNLMQDVFHISVADQHTIEKEIRCSKIGPMCFPTLDKYISDNCRDWFRDYVEVATPAEAREPSYHGHLTYYF